MWAWCLPWEVKEENYFQLEFIVVNLNQKWKNVHWITSKLLNLLSGNNNTFETKILETVAFDHFIWGFQHVNMDSPLRVTRE